MCPSWRTLVPVALASVGIGLLICPGPAHAAEPLQASELLLVYNRLEPAGEALAKHYAEVRQVPADRFCPLEVPPRNDQIEPEDFERLIRQPIRDYLTKHKLRDKVRCLVTFYGLPIRVGQAKPVPGENELRSKFRGELADVLTAFDRLIREIEGIGGGKPTLPPLASQPTVEDFPRLAKDYMIARREAIVRLERLRQQGQGGDDLRRILAIFERIEGAGRILEQMSPSSGVNRAAAEERIDQMRQSARIDLAVAYDLLALDYRDPARERGRQTMAKYEGIIGLVLSLRNDLARLETAQSESAVDSELMLLWWRVYPRSRWVLNPLNWRLRANANLGSSLPPGDRDEPVLLVARLDAPTYSVARRMIDDTVRAEKQGLAGNVYIDTRGLPANTGHGALDQNLRDLAAMLSRDTSLPMIVDRRPEVFAPRSCPNAMLYCGWYSLRKYVDAFKFVPGAVGYHIASLEAVSLHQPQETGWCRGLLLRGITATVGPVAEPYGEAFPKPQDFFGLLLTGRFSLAECYAYTIPFNSWMMVLLGDPLYRPFAAKPLLAVEQVFEANLIPAEFRPPSK